MILYSEFELEHLLLEGHCFEQSTGNPPRGLQFTLGNSKQPVMVGGARIELWGFHGALGYVSEILSIFFVCVSLA